ncbi:MAG: tetratricopeptide repeat protein [Longimicrobiales bacterium]
MVLAISAAVAVMVINREPTPSGVPLTAFPRPRPAPADSVHFTDFVGSASCAGCHSAQFAAWSSSTHGRAGEAPPSSLLLRRFDGTPIRFRDATVEPRVSGGRYEFLVHWPRGTDRYSIEGVVGAAHMMGGGTQGFLWRHQDGSLRLLPFEITGSDSTWFCSTGTRANRGWVRIRNTMSIADCGDWPPVRVLGSSARYASCQECHGSQIELRAGERPNETRYQSLTINCESCHGPGRAHIERVRTQPQAADLAMKPLGTLSRDASVGVCMSCHAIKVDVRRGFLPGRDLEERYSLKFPLLDGEDLHPDGRTRSFAYQQGHLYSDCYLSGSMTCVDCHEPHGQQYRDITGRALAGRLDDGQCTDCHPSKAQQPQLHTHHAPNSTGSRCVSCHMPFVQESAVGAELRYARSDHTISIPRPAVDLRLGVVNACRTCHTDRSAEQLGQDTRRLWGELKPLRPVIAGLLASERMEELERTLLARDTTHKLAYFDVLARHFSRLSVPDARSTTRQMRNRLWQLADSRDDDHAALALATLHFDAGRDARVRSELVRRSAALGTRETSIRRRWAVALGHRGDALRESGRGAEAITAYEKALELLPDDAAFLLALGQARLQRGNAEGASATLRRAVDLENDNSLLHINYGLARSALGDEAGAAAAYARAVQVNPYDGLAHFNLGNAFLRQQKHAEAAAEYRRAIELDASLAPAHFNLARVLLLQGKEREALAVIRTGLIFDPNQADARNAAAELEAKLGTAAPPSPR